MLDSLSAKITHGVTCSIEIKHFALSEKKNIAFKGQYFFCLNGYIYSQKKIIDA